MNKFKIVSVLLNAFFIWSFGKVFLVYAQAPIVINEIMWDGEEYVELYNPTEDTVSLTGWHLAKQAPGAPTKEILQFTDTDLVAPHSYFLIAKKETTVTVPVQKVISNLSLLNSGEQLTLTNEAGGIVDQANGSEGWLAGANTETGQSMERDLSGDDGTVATSWHTAVDQSGGRFGTPGRANSQAVVNQSPDVVLNGPTVGLVGQDLRFSAEDTTDPEADTPSYSWQWGDETSIDTTPQAIHSYAHVGSYTIRLTVTDGHTSVSRAQPVTITQPTYTSAIKINEVLPDPAGLDTTDEFIELVNTGLVSIDLTGWQIDDAQGGSTPYTLPSPTIIAAGSLLSFTRAATKLALNNSDESVRLLDPSGKVQAAFTYTDSAPEGQSYNRLSDDHYQLSTTVTPGSPNIITQPVTTKDEAEDPTSESTNPQNPTPTPTATSPVGHVAGTQAKVIPLEDIRQEKPGTVITTKGVVSVPPNILGDNIFYLAGSGIQVYVSEGVLPQLVVGNTVEVTGTLTSYQGEARLKVAQSADITKVTDTESPPQPHQVSTGVINQTWEGSLVITQGKVTQTDGATFYIDDGSGPVKVFIKDTTHIQKPPMKKGDNFTIIGVVSRTTSGYRLLPRFQDDVQVATAANLTTFPTAGTFNWLEFLRALVISWPFWQ